jgi:hypothetical protein
MAYAYFDVEVTNELNGDTMNFEYSVDLYDYNEEEVQEYATRIGDGDNHDLVREILDWISVTPRLTYVDKEA